MATGIFGPKNLRALAKRKLDEQRQKMMERRQGGALKQEASPESPRRKAREEAKSSQAQASKPARGSGMPKRGAQTNPRNIAERRGGRILTPRNQISRARPAPRASERPAPRSLARRP